MTKPLLTDLQFCALQEAERAEDRSLKTCDWRVLTPLEERGLIRCVYDEVNELVTDVKITDEGVEELELERDRRALAAA